MITQIDPLSLFAFQYHYVNANALSWYLDTMSTIDFDPPYCRFLSVGRGRRQVSVGGFYHLTPSHG